MGVGLEMRNVLSVINVIVLLVLAVVVLWLVMNPVGILFGLVLALPVGLSRWALRPDAGKRVRSAAAIVNWIQAVAMVVWIIGLLSNLRQSPDSYGIELVISALAALWLMLCAANALFLTRYLVTQSSGEGRASAAPLPAALPEGASALEAWLHRIGMARYVENFGRHGVAIEDLDAMTLERMCEIVHDRDDARSIMDEILEGSHVDNG